MIDKTTIKEVDTTLFKGDQLDVFNKTIKFFEKPNGGILRINGNAGTGKTFIVQKIIEHLLMTTEKMVAMLAPTAQAVRVCKDNADYTDKRIQYKTIHSAFNMRPIKKGDKQVFVPMKGARPIAEIPYIFIDEVSMLDDTLFELMLQEVNIRKHVVLIGDIFQIPPINHSYSKPFMQEYVDIHNISIAEMGAPIRQLEGNPILDNGIEIVKNIKENYPVTTMNDVVSDNGEFVFHLDYNKDKEELHEMIKEYFENPLSVQDSNFVKVLCWTNKEVDYWNRFIRPIVFKRENLNRIELGEKLLADEPYVIDKRPIFSTNEVLTVLDLFEDSTTVYDNVYKFYGAKVAYYNDNGDIQEIVVNILHEDSKQLYDNKVKAYANEAYAAEKNGDNVKRGMCWGKHWGLRETFLNVKYDYAKTAHKSQGGTYEHTFVMMFDILKNRKAEERNRIAYVACTRPKKSLTIIH